MTMAVHQLQMVNIHHTLPLHILIMLFRKVVFLFCSIRVKANMGSTGFGSLDRLHFKPSPFYTILEPLCAATQVPGNMHVRPSLQETSLTPEVQ